MSFDVLEVRFTGPLKVLSYLSRAGEVPMLRISVELKMNYRTVVSAVKLLEKLGFINQKVIVGPPPKRLISLTDKGVKAAQHAKELLRLAGKS